jgi:hypothetical protein
VSRDDAVHRYGLCRSIVLPEWVDLLLVDLVSGATFWVRAAHPTDGQGLPP